MSRREDRDDAYSDLGGGPAALSPYDGRAKPPAKKRRSSSKPSKVAGPGARPGRERWSPGREQKDAAVDGIAAARAALRASGGDSD